jgi:redox-sensitive bicupin YhaK (pirin superfamily)
MPDPLTRVVDTQVLRAGPGHQLRPIIEPGEWQEHDPFLLLNEDWFSPGTFGDHPHRGFETVTFVLEGELAHRDNRGNSGILRPGDAQWMTAGAGIIHSEEPHGASVHTLQLWINLPRAQKMVEPRYQDLRGSEMPVRREQGAVLRVYSGRSGDVTGPAKNHVPVTMVEMRLEAGASFTQDLPPDCNAFYYIIEGACERGSAGQAVWTRSPAITVQARTAFHAILWAGPPIREPVVQYGPFVMNTPGEIRQAFLDFQSGKF